MCKRLIFFFFLVFVLFRVGHYLSAFNPMVKGLQTSYTSICALVLTWLDSVSNCCYSLVCKLHVQGKDLSNAQRETQRTNMVAYYS